MGGLQIIVMTRTNTVTAHLNDGDILDIKHKRKIELRLEYSNGTLIIKNENLIKQEKERYKSIRRRKGL